MRIVQVRETNFKTLKDTKNWAAALLDDSGSLEDLSIPAAPATKKTVRKQPGWWQVCCDSGEHIFLCQAASNSPP